MHMTSMDLHFHKFNKEETNIKDVPQYLDENGAILVMIYFYRYVMYI